VILHSPAPDAAKMLADRVKKLSHELFNELITQLPGAGDNMGKVRGEGLGIIWAR
jgi:hypothetical protein